jgi:hypothetical protein
LLCIHSTDHQCVRLQTFISIKNIAPTCGSTYTRSCRFWPGNPSWCWAHTYGYDLLPQYESFSPISTQIAVLDVQAGNVLITTGERSQPDEPVIERDVNILGQKYTALLVPQPLPNFWSWDDDRMTAELYGVILNDLGTGSYYSCCCETLFSNILTSLLQQNGWTEKRTIRLPLHSPFELLKSFCRPGTTSRLTCGQLDVWCAAKRIIGLR